MSDDQECRRGFVFWRQRDVKTAIERIDANDGLSESIG
jgi:hypothetical protein